MFMDSQITNNLNVLYSEVQNIKKHSSSHIEVTPIGDTKNILCFTIFYNHEASVIIYTKDVLAKIFVLKSTAYKDISFQYYIQQNSVDEYAVICQSDYQNLQDKTIAEIQKSKPKSYTHTELLDLLRREFQTPNEKLKNTILHIAETNKKNNKAIADFLKRIAKNIGIQQGYYYDSKNDSFSFLQTDEDKLHRLFLTNGARFKQVCRYCTLETLFQMLSNQNIRMYGLAGMNDKSEYKYACDCFLRGNQPTEETEDSINRTYVLSCSSIEQKDSLEMWRLYGDDGKGVCLIFDVDKPKAPLLLAKTIYEFTRERGRKQIDKRWQLLKQLTTELQDIGLPLKINNPNKWLPFFKSGDYYYEREVRLLYEESDQDHLSHNWVLNNANSIFTPYIQFNLLDKIEQETATFPLKLKGIILGPKCQEKDMNVKQIINMLQRDSSLRTLNVNIQLSEITNYR